MNSLKTASQKIIFADIDDVSNSDRSIAACTDFDEHTAPPVRIPRRGDSVAMALFNRACENAGAKVVVSSTWLDSLGWSYTRAWLVGSGFEERHFHQHSHIDLGPGTDKRAGIIGWLNQHPEVSIDQICVVDDDIHLFKKGEPLRKRQVVVRGPDGLLLEHFRSVIQKLGKAK